MAFIHSINFNLGGKAVYIGTISDRFESSEGIFSGAEGFGRYSTAANHLY